MYSLQYLAHLVLTKNELNRRRRRFYSLINVRTKWIGYDANHKPMIAEYARHPAYTAEEASQGYNKACADMRAMTAHMRDVRKALGAKFKWAYAGWHVERIEMEGKRYNLDEIRELAKHYVVDSILLGE